mgnify:CR=1 FL=1
MKKVLAVIAVGLIAFGCAFAQTDVNGMETEQEKIEKEDTPVDTRTKIIQVDNTHPEYHTKSKNTATVEIQYTPVGGVVRITYQCPRALYLEDEARITLRACMEDFLHSMELSWSDVQTTNLQGIERNSTLKQDNGRKMKMI